MLSGVIGVVTLTVCDPYKLLLDVHFKVKGDLLQGQEGDLVLLLQVKNSHPRAFGAAKQVTSKNHG